ncbi:MAG: HAMP domain-containing sensor histidine kinase [Acidimicrobiia bacterium]|nr:HAMP domain-containing sensor histidine kinase [Acidimicrobiia bacterium]
MDNPASAAYHRLRDVPYREVLDGPGITRAHNFQRMASYGSGLVLAMVVDMPRWRIVTVAAICATQIALAAMRVARDKGAAPYPLAQLDQLAAGVAIAAGTGSFLITTAAVAMISAAIAGSFRAPLRVAVPVSLATGVPPILMAFLLDRGNTDSASYGAVLVLIVIGLTLSAFILGFFAVQTRQLRDQLTDRERQIDAILDVTPVVLAAVDESMSVTTLAGNAEPWLALSGSQVATSSQLASLVRSTGNGERATGDITLAGHTYNVTCDPGTNGETLVTAYDVTARTEAKRRLEEVLESKDQFIAAVSHELRTPLASVLGFSEIIRERMQIADPLEPMIVEVADQSAEMAAIIDDLLIAARSRVESVPTEQREINLAAEANGVIASMGSRLGSIPETCLDNVIASADPIRVRQIVRNLLTNADRYGGDEVRLETRVAEDAAVLIVRDSGDPLPAERRDLIFEPYESSGPVRGQPAAMGLGLAVSRTLAELMGGSISYDHDGKWSVFELRLPRVGAIVR